MKYETFVLVFYQLTFFILNVGYYEIKMIFPQSLCKVNSYFLLLVNVFFLIWNTNYLKCICKKFPLLLNRTLYMIKLSHILNANEILLNSKPTEF